MSSVSDQAERVAAKLEDFGVEDPKLDFEAANNPSPIARAIQMPLSTPWLDKDGNVLGSLLSESGEVHPWVNAVINAYNKRVKK